MSTPDAIIQMRKALKPFVDAANRLDQYGTPCPDAPLFIDYRNCWYELLHNNEEDQVTTNHLRDARKAYLDSFNDYPE